MIVGTLTIVGVGLIGGSIGLAARRRRLAGHIIGVGRQASSLDRALAVGAIDDASLDLADAVHRADVAIFCTPVDRIVEQICSVASHCRSGTVLTDAGSTKAAIVRGVDGQLPTGVSFVGSHPLAGSEKRGPEHADADLFQDRITVVTRDQHTDPAAFERVTTLWRELGARVRVMTPDDHDRALAMTSHLPHLLASALAGVLPADLFDLTATGFRDTTRVAAGDSSIWTGIFSQNRLAVLDALGLMEERLRGYRAALERNDCATLDTLLSQAKKVRDALGS
jgi:prephenate dehydrogenase